MAHVRRINVRGENSWFPLYFKISCCWHPSLRIALSPCKGQEVDCVDGSILLAEQKASSGFSQGLHGRVHRLLGLAGKVLFTFCK